MIDIVTVVFQEELSVLKIQAQSIDLYCQDIGIKNIYVLVNDNDSMVNDIDIAWWGSLQGLVRIIPRSVFSTRYINNGWITQQVLKLLGSSMSYNKWSLVLDAKTIISSHWPLDKMFNSQGALTCGWGPRIPVFAPAYKIANDLFGCDNQEILLPSGVPFFFCNTEVRQMIAEVEYRTKQDFPLWFQQQGMLTEFVLYATWIKYRYGDQPLLYAEPDVPWLKTMNICHNLVNRYEQLMSQVTNDTLTVGVHRRAWEQLSFIQQQQFKQLLTSRGITL